MITPVGIFKLFLIWDATLNPNIEILRVVLNFLYMNLTAYCHKSLHYRRVKNSTYYSMSIYDGRFFFLFAQHMSEGGMSTTIFNDQMKNKINKAVGTMVISSGFS